MIGFAIDFVRNRAPFAIPALLLTLCLFPSAPAAQRQPQPPKVNREPLVRPPTVVEQIRDMSPEERRRFLRSLPPERRRRLEKRLMEYEALPPRKREQLDRTYQKFSELPPQQQQAVREAFGTFSQLPADRKQVMRQEMRNLRSLTPEQRRKRMNGKEFQNEFNPNERQIMQQMTDLSNPASE